MGVSTVGQLIAKGKAQNAYNNAGIASDSVWMDLFNDALRDLVDDINIQKPFSIAYDGTTREYDLPSDYFSVVLIDDQSGNRIAKRRSYDQTSFGYFAMYRGSKWIMDLYKNGFAQTLTGLYIAYPTALSTLSDNPDIPTSGEMALPYYAIGKALRNQNQVGQAQEIESMYEKERLKIRTAANRGGG